MKAIIFYLWQLPQNILGLFMWGILSLLGFVEEKEHLFDHVLHIYVHNFSGGISLGRYVFLDVEYLNYTGKAEKHEYGHCRQSMMLGPLYLLIVGICSLGWATYRKIFRIKDDKYFTFWTERWADRLGGVKR